MQALQASPAPTHFSRLTDDSPYQDQVMIAQTLSPVVGGADASTNIAAAASAGAQEAAATSLPQGIGQSLLGEGPELLFRRLREVQDANGIVARQIEEMHGARYSVPNISGFKEVRTNLDQCAQELERRTHLLANGITAATGGVEAVRAGVVQLEQMLGGHAAATTNSLQQLARETEELRAQMNILHNRTEQLTADTKTSFSSLDRRIADLEGKDLIHDASLESIRQQLQVLESIGGSGNVAESDEAVMSTLNAIREEQDRATHKVLERVVALERVTQKLKDYDVKISAELEHVLRTDEGRSNAAPLEGAKPKAKPHKAVQFQEEEIKSPGPSAQHEVYTIGTPDTGLTGGSQIEGSMNMGWWDEPPGLEPPPALPKEHSKSASSTSSSHCDWKLLKQFPKIEKPNGQAWERGLQLGQYLTEMAQIASCVHSKFGVFVQQQIEAAQQRYRTRLEEGFLNLETPELDPSFLEYESRFSMALLGSVDPDIKKGVVEAALGQAVSSFQMLIAVLERFQPGGVEERASLTRFVRNLPIAGTFGECVATMRRLRLAIQRTSTLKLPSLPAHEMVTTLNNLVKNLERKEPTLSTRLNLMRLRPEILNPSDEGVSLMMTLIEQESRRLAAEEYSRPNNAKANGGPSGEYEVSASKGKGKDGKGSKICGFFNSDRGCLKGSNCDFLHIKSDGKGKGKKGGKDGGGAGASQSSSSQAAAAEEAKATAEAKAKAEAAEKKKAKKAAAKEAKAKAKAEAKPKAAPKAAALVGATAEAKGAMVVQANAARVRRAQPVRDPRMYGNNFLWVLRLSRWETEVAQRAVFWYDIPAIPHMEQWQIADPTDPQFNVIWSAWAAYVSQRPIPYLISRTGPDGVESMTNFIGGRIFPGLSAQDHLLQFEALNGGMTWSVWVKVQVPEPAPVSLIGELEDNLELSQEQVELLLGAVSDAEDSSEESVRPRELPPYRDGPWNDDAAPPRRRQSRADGSQDAEAADHSESESETETEIMAFSLFSSWIAGDSASEDEYDPRVRRRFRQMVENYQNRTPSNDSDVWPNAAMARCGTAGDGDLVLIDSGANEVLRSGPCGETNKSSDPLSVTLASGDTIQAFRNRHGEVCLPKEKAADNEADDSSWIVGIRRVIDLGGKFSWDPSGAFVSYPHPFNAETVYCQCIIQNGLPYIAWSDFRLMRIALSKQYKHQARGTQCNQMTTHEDMHIASWEDVSTVEEESRSFAHNVVSDAAEEAARQRLQQEGPISHDELLDLIRKADLKPVATRRTSKIEGSDKRVKAWVFGAYVHGPQTGLTAMTKQRPWLTQALARYMSSKSIEPFTSIVVADNLVFAPHQDKNCPDYRTTISGLSKFQGGQLWTEAAGGAQWRYVHTDRDPIPGQLHRLDGGRSVSFRGTAWHGTEPFKGDRVVVVSYVPRNWQYVTTTNLEVLSSFGFRVPNMPTSNAITTQRNTNIGDGHAFPVQTQEEREIEVKQFVACRAVVEDCVFGSNWLTIEEKRTLDHLGDQAFPERKQKPQLGSESMNTQPQQHIHPANSNTTSIQAHVGDAVDGRDRVHEGLSLSSEGYERIDDTRAPETRVEDATPLKPWDLSFLRGSSDEDQAVKDLWKRCREGVYDRAAESDLRARGHRRPHRKIHGPDIEKGVVSVDLSGPHKQSHAANKYAVVVCAHLADGCDLPFVRGVPNKEAKTVTDALCDVLTQLVSFAGGDQITFRIHSDQGKEFVAKIAQEQLKVFNHFRTFAVPYSHQSNGRVEQLIDTLKSSTGTFLLSGQLDVRFWDEVMSHAAKLRRMRALNIPIPKDLPIPGDSVLARRPADIMPDFEDRTERGVFLGLSDTVSNGSKILVHRGDRLFVRYARLPILINRVRPRWRVVAKPDSAEYMWVFGFRASVMGCTVA